jgi:hypothetical protein
MTNRIEGSSQSPSPQYGRSKVGFPIRRSLDQSSFAAPQGLSQRTTSFIASQRQGIHRMLLRHLIALVIDVHTRPGAASQRLPVTCKHGSQKDPRQDPFGSHRSCLPNMTVNPGSRRPHSHIPSSRCRLRMENLPPSSDRQAHANLFFPHPEVFSDQTPRKALKARWRTGGDRRDRTDDLMLAKQPLSQLSYVPERISLLQESQGDGGNP